MWTYLALLTYPPTQGIEIEDISSNLGLLPVRIGPARRINYYHTITHYYQLDGIINQINQLRTHVDEITDIIKHDSEIQKIVQSRILLVNHMLTLAEEKVSDSILPRRQKRGLLNGLGSVVKFVTGNLDANDEEKYNNIIQHLQSNQEVLSQQINHHYSINDKLIEELNFTLDTINYNHDILVREIEHLKEISSFSTHVKQVEDALEHNQLLIQLLLDLIQDIDNSVTFCKLGKMHPSIIKPQILLSSLRKLVSFFGNQLPDFEGESLWDIQNHIKIKCYVTTDEIVYFLDVPLLHTDSYDLLLLQPIPTTTLDRYVTVIPSTRYALRSRTSSELIFSNQPCETGLKQYFCPNNLQLSAEYRCESDILLQGVNGRCDLIQLKLLENHIEFLEETKRYIFIFPREDQVKIVSQGNIEFRKLSGIFLVSPGNSTIEYRNQTLVAPSTSTFHEPTLVKFVKSPTDVNAQPRTEIKLKSLKYLSPPTNPVPTNRELFIQFVTPSLWTILLYAIVISFFVFSAYRLCKYSRISLRNEAPQNCA